MAPASPPFDRDDADVVLRSSDNIDFRVHKMILSVTSPVFKDMFHVPQLAVEDTHPETGLALMQLAEDSRTLDIFLRLCYPFSKSVFTRLQDVHSVLRAARKHESEYGTTETRKELLAFVSQQPLRVYAIACSMDLKTEARAAARASPHTIPMDSLAFTRLGLDQITSGQLFRLIMFLRTSKDGVCEDGAPTATASLEGRAQPTPFRIPDIPDQPPDVIVRSSDGVDFHVHKLVFSLASPELACMVRESSEDSAAELAPTTDRLRAIVIPEDGQTLSKLLQFCYPSDPPEFDCLDMVHAVLAAAEKYQVAMAIKALRKRWTEHIQMDPLRTYFIAMLHGWMEEAREAAKYAVFHWRDIYVPEMDSLPAEAYRRLWHYHQRSQEAFNTVFAHYGLLVDSDISVFKTHNQLWIGMPSELATKNMSCSDATILSPVLARILRPMGKYRQSSRSVQSIIDESREVQESLQEALSAIVW